MGANSHRAKRRLYEAHHVWVVEMWCELPMKRGYWMPTVGVGLDREQGRLQLRRWKERGKDDRFRLVQYRSPNDKA